MCKAQTQYLNLHKRKLDFGKTKKVKKDNSNKKRNIKLKKYNSNKNK